MSKLVETYSRAAGLRIKTPYVRTAFFPLEDKPYVTVQGTSVNQHAKNYDHFDEVLDILAPILTQNNIKIYQIGGKDEKPLKHCHHLMGQTSIAQANYVVSRSLCHLSVDSFSAHVAGMFGRPLVSLYGNTDVANHGPFWHNPERTVLLESHRGGNKPSYGPEHYKTINQITPESIVNAVLKVLAGNGSIERKSLLFGAGYHNTVIEWVPDAPLNPDFVRGQALIARLDYAPDNLESEQHVVNALQNRPLHLFTNRPVQLGWVAALKDKVALLNHEISDVTDVQYIKALKRTGVKLRFYTRLQDNEVIAALRLKFFDVVMIEKITEKTREDFFKEAEKYLNYSLDTATALTQDNALWFRSNKFILSKGKIYTSRLHFKNDAPVPAFEKNVMPLPDHPEFWTELDHYYIFRQAVPQ